MNLRGTSDFWSRQVLNSSFVLVITHLCIEHFIRNHSRLCDEEENMKKVLGILALVMVTVSLVGCDPAGEPTNKQRLSSAETSSVSA